MTSRVSAARPGSAPTVADDSSAAKSLEPGLRQGGDELLELVDRDARVVDGGGVVGGVRRDRGSNSGGDEDGRDDRKATWIHGVNLPS